MEGVALRLYYIVTRLGMPITQKHAWCGGREEREIVLRHGMRFSLLYISYPRTTREQ